MLVNLSNHKSSHWSKEQLKMAQAYGAIVDLPFPQIDPHMTDEELNHVVEKYRQKVLQFRTDGRPLYCMLQGEFVFTFRLVTKLKADGVTVLAGSSERRVLEETDESGHTRKQGLFVFVRFREY